jgi:hypothetical protein
MPSNKRQIPLPDGRVVEGTVMPFQVGGEHWNEYLTDDGSVIRVKLVATEMIRLDGEYAPDGQPIYLLSATNVMTVSAPDDLKRGGGK